MKTLEIVAFFLFALIPVIFIFASAKVLSEDTMVMRPTPTSKKRVASAFVLFTIGVVSLGTLIFLSFEIGRGNPIQGGDPQRRLESHVVGQVYQTMWQSQDGKRALIQRKDGTLSYFAFNQPVPHKYFVNDEHIAVPLDK